MFLKEIVLDGFKSYSCRTSVANFDRHFNAITGFNGSGKSNILDAICFVLGITNLSTLRASMLQDLIYKSGTAGVTSATVSLTFDNSDSLKSPSGYENVAEITVSRQINVNGKSKYWINGSPAQVHKVIDFFCSVHLDVNNPHFLILQGQITKVLNMKPKEILGLIEGAVGTLSYDSKRSCVLRIIEKKDCKLAEIQSLLVEEIGPVIERLKAQKTGYNELRQIEKDLQVLEHSKIVFAVKRLRLEISSLEMDLARFSAQIESLKQQKSSLSEELSRAGNGNEAVDAQAESGRRTEVAEAGKRLNACESDLVQLRSDLKTLQASLREQDAYIEGALAQIKAAAEEICRDEKLIQELTNRLESNPLEQLDQKIAAVRHKISDCRDYVVDEETGEAVERTELMLRLKTRCTSLEQSLRQARAHFEKCRRECELIAQQVGEERLAQAELLRKELDDLNDGIQSDAGDDNVDDELRELTRKQEALQAHLNSCPDNFHYNNPCEGFDRRRVYGQLGCLVRCKDIKKFGRAVENAFGVGRLLSIVVDTVETAKLMLSRCDFKQRVTIIPLNGIKVPDDVRNVSKLEQKAKELVSSGQHVWSALSLVECDASVRPCVEFALNTKFICSDLSTAKLIAFHPRLGGRVTITLDGDVFDPAGILTCGGRQPQGRDLLLSRLETVGTLQRELTSVQSRLEAVIARRNAGLERRHKFAQMRRRKCEIEDQLSAMGITDKQAADQNLKEATELVRTEQNRVEAIQEKLKALNANQQYHARPEDLLSELLRERKELEVAEQQVEALKLEISDRKEESSALSTQLDKAKALKAQLEAEERILKEKVEACETELANAKHRFDEANDELQRLLQIQKALDERREGLQTKANSLELELKSASCEKRSVEDRIRQCQQRIEEIFKKNSWLKQADMTDSNGKFDNCSEQEIERLRQLKARLRRTVNAQAVDMLGEKEEQYRELLRKEEIVKGNKAKLRSIIAEWDGLKRAALNTSWRVVSRDFGDIFATLLPGACAKLDLARSSDQTSEDVLDCGLDIHIGFGGQWKESLVELSGGQRSLAAMSLILALLRYRPAPIYIMDEIDAALDISHTQNMGLMIQRFFRESQFIIVSLKDGMFKNANVLFKTCLKDGVSCVTRYKNK